MSIREKLAKIATDMPKVYEAGKAEGEQAGRKAIWDGLQDYGNRTDYRTAFYGLLDEVFYPTHDIKPTIAQQMFSYSKITNLKQRLLDCGVKLDLSKATTVWEAFFRAYELTHLPVIDTTSATSVDYMIADCTSLVEVEKIILKADGSQGSGGLLGYCSSLERVTIEGTIGKNSINLSRSRKLNKASIISVINALSTTSSGLTATISITATNKEFETSAGANNGSTSAEWLALIATRPNWTIALSDW